MGGYVARQWLFDIRNSTTLFEGLRFHVVASVRKWKVELRQKFESDWISEWTCQTWKESNIHLYLCFRKLQS